MSKSHDVLKETTLSQAAFMQYQAMGPERSYKKLCVVLGKGPGYIRAVERWASAFNWQERVKAHDLAIAQKQAEEQERARLAADDEKRRARAAEIENMHKRHALIATTHQARAMSVLEKLIDAEEVSASAAISLLRTSVEMERTARGENAQRLEVSGPDGAPIRITTEWGTFKPVEDKGKNEQ